MKSKPLLDMVSLPVQNVAFQLSSVSSFEMKNGSCHLLFRDRAARSQFYESTLVGNGIVVVPCSGSGSFPSSFKVLDVPVANFNDLLAALENFLEGRLSLKAPLHTLVIDNISIFHWDLRIVDRTNYKDLGFSAFQSSSSYYLKFADILNRIHLKYSCNIVVTSFDINFDKGYKGNWKKSAHDYEGLSSLTYLPESYLQKFQHLVYVDGGELRVYKKPGNRWIEWREQEAQLLVT
ncbi:uncharacterized protein RJT20DRAFT_34096 [Scheffersomyces xylosifermentans]|uniref:uncharacterized protein n=1 Tax=Scheffersomyces xylosifermentans TaxID=1304137 RepID=UPI00315DC808